MGASWSGRETLLWDDRMGRNANVSSSFVRSQKLQTAVAGRKCHLRSYGLAPPPNVAAAAVAQPADAAGAGRRARDKRRRRLRKAAKRSMWREI